MAKLGYTWYPNDWKMNEKVFNMRLELRGFYREFIDFAYQNDNNFTLSPKYWCRLLGINKRKFDKLFAQLLSENLIEKNGEMYFIPSVDPRIRLIRGGRRGGKKSKPKPKPKLKPNAKPDRNQIEREIERERKGDRLMPTLKEFSEYGLARSVKLKINLDIVKLNLKYESWKENDWKDGNDIQIKNWKSKLLNTLPYLKKDQQAQRLLNDKL